MSRTFILRSGADWHTYEDEDPFEWRGTYVSRRLGFDPRYRQRRTWISVRLCYR